MTGGLRKTSLRSFRNRRARGEPLGGWFASSASRSLPSPSARRGACRH